jgi:predicted RNA-binding protein with PUA-like domain
MHFLLKTEPSTYNFDDLLKDKKTTWDGVTSPGGLFQLKRASNGDLAFIYHTGKERAAVGIAEIISDPYPDKNNAKLWVFDLKPKSRLKNPVTLEMLKADKRFKNSRIVKEGRLSVVPLTDEEWSAINDLSKISPPF